MRRDTGRFTRRLGRQGAGVGLTSGPSAIFGANLRYQWDADVGITEATGVGAWLAIGATPSTAGELVQAVGADQPAYTAQGAGDAPNGHAYVTLASVDHGLSAAATWTEATADPGKVLVFGIVRFPAGIGDNGANAMGLHVSFSPLLTCCMDSDATAIVAKAHGTQTADMPKHDDQWQLVLFGIEAGADKLSMRYDGETQVTGNGSTGVNLAAAVQNIFGFSGASVLDFDCSFWGIVAGQSDATAEQWTALQAWAVANYGIDFTPEVGALELFVSGDAIYGAVL